LVWGGGVGGVFFFFFFFLVQDPRVPLVRAAMVLTQCFSVTVIRRCTHSTGSGSGGAFHRRKLTQWLKPLTTTSLRSLVSVHFDTGSDVGTSIPTAKVLFSWKRPSPAVYRPLPLLSLCPLHYDRDGTPSFCLHKSPPPLTNYLAPCCVRGALFLCAVSSRSFSRAATLCRGPGREPFSRGERVFGFPWRPFVLILKHDTCPKEGYRRPRCQLIAQRTLLDRYLFELDVESTRPLSHPTFTLRRIPFLQEGFLARGYTFDVFTAPTRRSSVKNDAPPQ